jgi:hypothetical protein
MKSFNERVKKALKTKTFIVEFPSACSKEVKEYLKDEFLLVDDDTVSANCVFFQYSRSRRLTKAFLSNIENN